MTSLRVPSPGGIPRARLWLVASVFMLWGACALFTLHRLQIVRVDDMRARARRQQECIIRVEPRRGMILDRMGRQLAVSTDAFTVYASASQVGEEPGSLAKLAHLLGVPPSRVARKLARGGFVLLERRLAPDVADAIRDAKIPGVELVAEAKRFYPQGELAAQVLGFVVPDNPDLREGLEQRYDDVIRGTPGAWLALRDATGRHIRMEARQAPAPGHDIVTSIDEVIQHIAERELAAAVRETGARGGMVVVLNTPTGEVLALANRPTFNPNQYGKAKPAARRDRVVTDYYEPGSTFKIITAAAAIDEGLVRASEAIDCENGLIRVAGVPIRDHKPFGILSFREVIEESSNVCAIKVGMRLSRAAFYDYVARFGFGARTGIDLPGETPGLLRPTSRWSATSQAYMSFGQEIAVSALQVAAAFSAVANGGVWVPPHVVTRVLDPDGRSAKVPELPAPRRVISESTARTLVDLMEATVWEGTGKKAAVPGYRAAGKTGTAQKYAGGKTYSESQFIASFCGFVPARHPVLTIHVVLDDPSGDHYHGGDVAAPA
ncbi:MAG TPA: penicillin-binding protein 2, partial [Candidatus Saccharimonadales bacterium]|nr:penicillin-binding protein 2 [Candidatus Saccharimonadales bacterium]